jgi:hypothetical protein
VVKQHGDAIAIFHALLIGSLVHCSSRQAEARLGSASLERTALEPRGSVVLPQLPTPARPLPSVLMEPVMSMPKARTCRGAMCTTLLSESQAPAAVNHGIREPRTGPEAAGIVRTHAMEQCEHLRRCSHSVHNAKTCTCRSACLRSRSNIKPLAAAVGKGSGGASRRVVLSVVRGPAVALQRWPRP